VSSSGASVRIQFTPDLQAPSAPGNLGAVPASSSSMALSWSASTDNVGVTGYHVYRNNVVVASPTGTSYTDTGLTPATSYSYQVTARDAAGNESAKSNVATASTPSVDVQAPTAPSNLRGSVGKARTVSLTWSASTDNVGVTAYRVYRNNALIGTVTATSALNRPGRGTFSYQVSAIDAAGNEGARSNTVSVST
jgi:chitodextrinase